MAVVIKSRKGSTFTLLNPAEKGTKYAVELKEKVGYTNSGYLKTDDYDNAIPLSPLQKAFRSGYLQSRKDSANCYKSKMKKMSTRKSRTKK